MNTEDGEERIGLCGITGWINYDRNIEEQDHIITKMADTLSKRGPDDHNIWSSKHALLGHTRLIVVDPQGGAQPMSRYTEKEGFTIVYNGELYNTEEIRKLLLERGHRFRSHSDTEVLLHSYMEWGPDCVHRLNGIFAFAIWNDYHQTLFMARDRLGVKPLFYVHKAGNFIFGSELKSVLAHPEVDTRVDEQGLAEIFGLGPSRTPGQGVFKHISELRPGHFLFYRPEGLRLQRYWNVESKGHTDSLEQTSEKVYDLLQDAVKRQLVADVPICTFLSGGLDSSAITAFAANELRKEGQTLTSYSIDYVDNDQYFVSNEFQPNSDAAWVKKVSTALQTDHHSLFIDTEQLVDYLKEAVLVRDLPGMADIDSSLLWFCKEIKKHATVGLSGECADEIFGGYPWFHKPELLHGKQFPWMDSLSERVQLLQPEWQHKLKLEEYVQQRYLDTIAEVPRLPGESGTEAKRREMFYLNQIWFMTTLLDRKDRMSMGASLEVRVPFADHRLVEYVWNIPWEMKCTDQREKGILRRALQGALPEDVLYRKKSPYPKTHHPLYTKAVQKWVLEIIDDSHSPILSLINKDRVEEIARSGGNSFKKPWFGQLMTGPQLLAHIAQIDFWLREYQIKIS